MNNHHARYRAYYRELLACLLNEAPEDAWVARRGLRWAYRQWLCGPPLRYVRPRAVRALSGSSVL